MNAMPELSVVMPCLNEADTLASCVQKAFDGLKAAGIPGEVIVADNGSTDGSQQIATSLGARVVDVKEKGYGSALMGGIEAARSPWIIMGDADDSYDFREIPKFVEKLKAGFELVQGCRLPSGGGRVLPGAMPFLHRWWGNPMFTWLTRWWFHAPIHDVYCGLRAFTKDLYFRIGLRCTGMEFATEMIIKSCFAHARVAEVPITLHPDGRKAHAPHLKTFRDGWRTLRFFLLFSPRWLFLIPGCLLVFGGVLGFGVALSGPFIHDAVLEIHTLVISSLFILCGYQSVIFAILTKTFGILEGFLPRDRRLRTFFKIVNLERGLVASLAGLLVGVVLLAWAVIGWHASGVGKLDFSQTMRLVVPGATITALAFQTVCSSFFMSILGLSRKNPEYLNDV